MARCQVHILLMFLFESGFNSQMISQQIRLFLKYCTFPTKCCSFGFAIAFTFPQFAPRPVLVIFYRSTDNNLQLGGSFGYRFNFFPTTGNNSHPGDSFGCNYNRGWACQQSGTQSDSPQISTCAAARWTSRVQESSSISWNSYFRQLSIRKV